MADNLLKRLSNAAVLPNGNLFFRIETRSGVLDIECGKHEITDIFTFLVKLAAAAPQAPAKSAEPESFSSFPLRKIGLQESKEAGHVTLLIQTLGEINMGFNLPQEELQRFAGTLGELVQSRKG
jgi:hypothetical protein